MLESKVRMKGTGSQVRMTDSKALMIVFLQEISSVFLFAAGLYRWYCLRRVGWYILESPVKTLLPPLAPPPPPSVLSFVPPPPELCQRVKYFIVPGSILAVPTFSCAICG